MRLAPLLAGLSEVDLERLAKEHVRTDEPLPRPQLCNFLEGAIRSYRFVNDFVVNRQPPTFAMLTLLLNSQGYEHSSVGLREVALAETQRLMEAIGAGELVARDRQLHLYRRALYEARRSDFDLNASEAALLALLRREQSIAQVEHFLIEHHEDLREFWDTPDCYEHEHTALRSAGLLFEMGDRILLPEDVAPAVWQTLGIEMPAASARRLFDHLSGSELGSALESAGVRTSGSREVRIERLVTEYVQPRVALGSVQLTTLKEICRTAGASVSGNKEELIERIVSHFADGKDQRIEEAPQPPVREPRRLEQDRFETMFNVLQHQELSDILRRLPNLRQTGTKETRIGTLWEAHLSETTLLSELMNRQLEDVLHRLGLRLGGSKGSRIERIIEHFGSMPLSQSAAQPIVVPAVPKIEPLADRIRANQMLFRQKASNPQASLQPWLEEVLGGDGLIRCYATEDANPTKQLKNKLAQAAAAREGLLVLLLADEASYLKAKEALLERWLANSEWSKSVACVALAYPLTSPDVATIIERGAPALRWSKGMRINLYPSAEVLVAESTNATADSVSKSAVCSRCGNGVPSDARFCSYCGAELRVT